MTQPSATRNNSPRFLLLVLILLVFTILTLGLIYFDAQKERITRNAEDELTAIAEIKAGQIVQWRNERLADGRVINRNFNFVRDASELLDGTAGEKQKQMIFAYLKSLAENYEYGNIFLFDRTMNVKYSIGDSNDVPASFSRGLVTEALQSRQVILSDLHFADSVKQIRMNLAVPLEMDEPGESSVVGILLLRVDPYKSLYPLIQSWPIPSATSESFICRKDSGVVTILNDLRHRPSSALNVSFPLDRRDIPAVKAGLGVRGTIEGVDLRNVPVFASIKEISNSPWVMVAKVDKDEVLTSLRLQEWVVGIIGALVFFLGSAVMLIWWRNQSAIFYRGQYEAEVKHRALIQHFDYLVKYANDIILLADESQKIVEANDRAIEAYGYSREEIIGLHASNLRSGGTIQQIRDQARLIEKQGGAFFESVHVRKNGSPFPVEVSARIIHVGERKYLQTIIRDITERRKVEAALRESEEHYRSLFENMGEGFAYCRLIYNHGLPVDFEFLTVNAAFESLSGLKNVVGKRVSDVIPGARGSNGENIQIYARVAATGIPERFEMYIEQRRAWFSVSAYSTKKGYFAVVFNNITDRKKSEETLSRLNRALASSGEVILMADLNGIINYINPAFTRLYGYEPDEVLGKISPKMLDAETHDHSVHELFWKTIMDKRTFTFEFNNRTKDGRIVPVESASNPIFDKGGNVTGYLSVQRDITERKKVAEALQKSEFFFKESQRAAFIGSYSLDFLTGSWNSSEVLDEILGIDKRFVRSIKGWLNIVHPDDREMMNRYFSEYVVARRKSFNKEYRIIRKSSGDTRWVFGLGELQLDSEGNLLSMIGTIQDITERKKAELAASDALNFNRTILESSPVGIFAYRENGEVISMNEAGAKIIGATKEQVGKQNFRELPSWKKSGLLDAALRVLSTGKGEDLETKLLTTHGEETWLSCHFERFLHEDIHHLLLIFSDVSEHKRSEESLIRLNNAVQSSGEVIFMTDRDGVFTFVNPAFTSLYGYEPDEVIGITTPRVLKSGKNDPAAYGQLWSTLLSKQTITRGFINRTKDGRLLEMEASVNPVLDAKGGILGFLAVQRDVTERKRAEDKIRRLSRTYAFLSEINQTIVRTKDEESLLEDACRNAVDVGELWMTWIGKVDPDTGDVRVVAASGVNEGYLDTIKVSIHGDRQEGRGPTGTALREKTHIICNDILHDQRMQPWRDEALRRGYSSSAAFPLIVFGKPYAVISFYSSEIGYFDEDEVTLLVELCADISYALEFLEKEKERKEIEKDRDRLFNLSIDMLSVTDFDGYLKQVNPAWEKTLGWTKEEMLSKPLIEFVHPDDRPATLKRIHGLQAGEQSYVFENRYICKNGSVKWLSWSTYPLPEERLMFSVTRDVTERKEAQEALLETERRYRSVFEESRDAIYITTIDGKFLDINPAGVKLLGYSSKEEVLASVNIRDLYWNPGDREEFILRLQRQGSVNNYERDLRTGSGKKLTLVENAVGIKNESGSIVLIRGTSRDVTVQRGLEQQLIQAQKLEGIGTLAGGIAHDFNNILGIILGYIGAMQHKEVSPQMMAKSLEIMTSAVDRGTKLVSQILTFARKSELNRGPLDVSVMIKEFSRMIAETFPKNIRIELDLRKSIPLILADATQFHQILLNIFVNARDAMPRGGVLTISTSIVSGSAVRGMFLDASNDKYLHLSISDTGQGMAIEVKNRIFEPFFTTKEKEKGTGLGLSTVYGIVKDHSGYIYVESEPGMGTRFHIYFPFPASSEILSSELLSTEGEVRGGTERILLVEDEELLVELVRTLLASQGYEVVVARDGMQAIEIYRASNGGFDLVLTDMDLPKLSGKELFDLLREMNPAVKLVFASGFVEPEMKAEMFSNGAKKFIEKPYRPAEMLRSIREALDQTE